jgi:hypothetical protein
MDNTPLPQPQGKRGKPLQKFDLELVEKLAARGLSYKQLAIALGMNIKTVKKHRTLNPALQEAIDRGRVKGLTEIANSLFESALNGNTTAQIFYLKNRSPDDWRDRYEQKVDIKADVTALHLDAMRELVPIEDGTEMNRFPTNSQ